MSKIDVLIIVHDEHEGFLSVRNSGRVLEAGKVLADRKSTRLNSSHSGESRMPSSA